MSTRRRSEVPPHDPADPLRRAVREAVSAYASEPVAERLLESALATAALAGVPRSPRALERFVARCLRPEIAEVLGEEAADGVVERLATVITAIDWRDAGVPLDHGDTFIPDQSAESCRVIVLGDDARLAATLRLELRGGAIVVSYPTLREADGDGALGRSRCAIVLDGRCVDPLGSSVGPKVDGKALVAVLAWGAPEAVAARARTSFAAPVPIVGCGEEVTIEELALLLRARLGLRG
ncbi:MAG: hypothetical protein M3Y87_05510 [Myxococcota bacterium]|nr:hypothetical protein [Myxococcota bacterium]